MTGSATSSRSRLNACRAKPTKAKPKTTLFGSNMEKVDPDLVQKQTADVDLDDFEESLKPKRQVRNPPPVLAAEIKDPAKLVEARSQLEVCKRDLKDASHNLNTLEQQALYRPDQRTTDIPLPGEIPITDRPHQWMNVRDLANASSINVLGVDPRKPETYNRDRYEKRSPVHEYKLNGDPMNRGEARDRRHSNSVKNSSSQIDLADPIDQKMYLSNYQKHYGETKTNDEDLQFGVKLPKNIEHLFGTKVCQSLLGDKDQVASTLEQQARARARNRRGRSSLTPDTKDVKFSMYEDLGNALRHDHFPGFSTDNRSSTMKEMYTDDVHKQHIPGPDQYRYQRDELTNWLDAIFTQDRLKNAGKEVETKLPQPKLKPMKPAVKRPRKQSVVSEFEPVQFLTPPKTPEKVKPNPEHIIQFPGDFEKDKEFWNYYDEQAAS